MADIDIDKRFDIHEIAKNKNADLDRFRCTIYCCHSTGCKSSGSDDLIDLIKQAIVDWLREILLGGIISNLSGLYDSTNTRVAEIAGQVGTTPAAWNSSIYNMIRALSDNVILPIAGVVLAFVMTLELIQLIVDRNNMHDDVC